METLYLCRFGKSFLELNHNRSALMAHQKSETIDFTYNSIKRIRKSPIDSGVTLIHRILNDYDTRL